MTTGTKTIAKIMVKQQIMQHIFFFFNEINKTNFSG